jgi:hypothetical protein
MGVVKLSTAGIRDYSKTSNFLGLLSPIVSGTFDLLQTQVLTTNETSVTFGSLGTYSADYKHLQIRATIRGGRSNNGDNICLRFNGDSGSNYSRHALYGQNGVVNVYAATGQSYSDLGNAASATTPANVFTGVVADILDPFSASKNTTVRTFNGLSANNPLIGLMSGAWYNTSAVSSMNIFCLNGSLQQFTRISLYGVRG